MSVVHIIDIIIAYVPISAHTICVAYIVRTSHRVLGPRSSLFLKQVACLQISG